MTAEHLLYLPMILLPNFGSVTTTTIIGIVAALAVVMTRAIVTPAFAIKNFFICMTDIANEHGKLTLDDVHMRVHKEYSVYRNIPYGIFGHSFSGGGGSGGH